MKSLLGVLLALSSLSSLAAAQCTTTSPSNCGSPLGVKQSTPPVPAAIILIDSGLPPPIPAVKQYIVSIKDSVVQESDNGGPYHTLVGPKGDPGQPGVAGASGKDGVNGTNGVNGKDGINGINGTNGKDGANGVNGVQGLQGVPGIPGVDLFPIGSSITVTVTGCNIVGVGRTCVLKRVK